MREANIPTERKAHKNPVQKTEKIENQIPWLEECRFNLLLSIPLRTSR